MGLPGKVAQSKELIRDIARRTELPLLVLFSAGKDSLAVLLLAAETVGLDRVECLFMESSIDLPGSVEFAESLAAQMGVKLHRTHPRHYQGDFAALVRRWGYFPDITTGWCSIRLKVRPARAYLRKVFGKATLFKLSGVRAEESNRRRRLYRSREVVALDPEHHGSYLVHPILNWTDNDVRVFLKANGGIPVSPLYERVGVSGCYWCPFYHDEIVLRIQGAFPGIYDGICALEREIGKPSLTGRRYLSHLLNGGTA